MEKRIHIGEYWTGEEYVEEIVKVGDEYFIVSHQDSSLNKIEKEKIQWAMTNPWSETTLKISFNEYAQTYIASYSSVVYDGIEMTISGIGKEREQAVVNLSKNIIELFKDYNKEILEKIMKNI